MASWLDIKLGIRMLVKHPVLTVAGGLAMAFAIGAGAGAFEAIRLVTNPVLPWPEGDRIVGFTYWDATALRQKPTSTYDFRAWRGAFHSVGEISAFRLTERNLTVDEGGAISTQLAEISAAAFRLTRVPPLMGRTLLESDEAPGAPPAVVVGHRFWQARFRGDPAIVGRVVRLDGMPATVVGVMPPGFAFPVSQHLWTPLKTSLLPSEPGRAAVTVFGRLTPGASRQDAQAELEIFAARAAASYPEHYANTRAQVLPYPEAIMWIPPDFLVRAGIQAINALAALFLLVVCGNVALLMFARAAAREREILVRAALGASRNRIVAQFFIEALVLSALAAIAGLVAANLGLQWSVAAMSDESDGWPFWIEGGLSSAAVVYAVLLTILASAVAGVLPARKVTSGGLESRLRAAGAGGGGLRMGGIWTVVIVMQIAATVLFTGVAYVAQRQAAEIASTKAAFPAEQYLAAGLEMDTRAAYADIVRSLQRRLAAEPLVAGVALAERLPLQPQRMDLIEFEDASAVPTPGRTEYRVAAAGVDAEFFDVFGTRDPAGRAFSAADVETGANVAVVNRLFVERYLAGRSAIGRRIRVKAEGSRPAAESAPWIDIIGVVPDLVLDAGAPLRLDNPAKPVVYRPLAATAPAVSLAVRVRGSARAFEPVLRRIAADLSPSLRLTGLQSLDMATRSDARAWNVISDVIVGMSAIALFLSLAGIYAVVSFTVTRRTREIAVRVALGARAGVVVAGILRRPLIIVASGAALGSVPIGVVLGLSANTATAALGTWGSRFALLLTDLVLTTAVCGLACVGPAWRALRVQPTEALRQEQ